MVGYGCWLTGNYSASSAAAGACTATRVLLGAKRAVAGAPAAASVGERASSTSSCCCFASSSCCQVLLKLRRGCATRAALRRASRATCLIGRNRRRRSHAPVFRGTKRPGRKQQRCRRHDRTNQQDFEFVACVWVPGKIDSHKNTKGDARRGTDSTDASRLGIGDSGQSAGQRDGSRERLSGARAEPRAETTDRWRCPSVRPPSRQILHGIAKL